MEAPVIFLMFLSILSCTTDLICGEVIHASENPLPVGDNVTFYSPIKVTDGAWLFKDSRIVLISQSGIIISNNWRDRVKFNKNTSSLTITSVKLEDSGLYTLQSLDFSAGLRLSVQAPITAVTMNQSRPAILDEPLTLHCHTSGSFDRIQWWKNGKAISADNTTVFDKDNKTLTFKQVQLSDGGEFHCQAFNAVSNITSNHHTMEFNYNPTAPVITGPSMGLTGVPVFFNCLSISHPQSKYSWYFKTSLVATTSRFKLGPLTLDMSGVYTCTAYNSVTNESSSSQLDFTVFEPITNLSVKAVGSPPILNHSFILACEGSGSYDSLIWMYRGSQLKINERHILSEDNATLTFSPLLLSDNGAYSCKALNPLSGLVSGSYELTVFYGPEKPIISGPSSPEVGLKAQFNCSAISVPPSQISWWHNSSLVANTSVLIIGNISLKMSGEYKCEAYNPVTRKTTETFKQVTVIDVVKSVTVKASQTAVNGENITLTCEITGSYTSVYWLKDGIRFGNNNSKTNPHISYHMENKELLFTPVTLDNDGTYQCVAVNQSGTYASKQFNLLVDYGPLSVKISGPSSAKQGERVGLKCITNSRPDCEFQWLLNNQTLATQNSDVIDFVASKDKVGIYMCKARNPVTNITMSQNKSFTLKGLACTIHLRPPQGLTLIFFFALSNHILFN